MRVAFSRGAQCKEPYSRGLAPGLSAASTDEDRTGRGFWRVAKPRVAANSVREGWVRGPIGSVAGGTGHVAEARGRLDIATSNDNVMYGTFWRKQEGHADDSNNAEDQTARRDPTLSNSGRRRRSLSGERLRRRHHRPCRRARRGVQGHRIFVFRRQDL